jgi:hypothetical protein
MLYLENSHPTSLQYSMIIEMAKYSNTILLPVEAWAGNSHMQALWQFLQSTRSPGSVVDFRGLNARLL